MPEAPDVKLVAEYIHHHYIGWTVTAVRGTQPLEGYTLVQSFSHGKDIFMEWSNTEHTYYTKTHLSLQGRLYDTHVQDKGHYFTLSFSNGRNLSLYDHMGNATFTVSETPFPRTGKCVMQGVTTDDVKLCLRGRSLPSCLVKQEHVKGIGGQLADNVLFSAKLDPSRKGDSLTQNEIVVLTDAINTVSQLVYYCGGFSHPRPVLPDGTNGFYVHLFQDSADRQKVDGRYYHTPLILKQGVEKHATSEEGEAGALSGVHSE